MNTMALASRLAIVAGGLGGIGSATGRLLRAQGARLAILYAPAEAPRLRESLSAAYGREEAGDGISTHECDITNPESVVAAFASLTEDLAAAANVAPPPFPNMLINAAGYVNMTPLEDTPPEDTIKHLHINILGPMLLSQAFAKMYFAASSEAARAGVEDAVPPGRIVSIASQAAHVSLPIHGAYCASKAGLIGLTKCMADEWGPRGITANTVSPGVVWTGLGKIAWADKTLREAHEAQIPTGRFSEPEEIASAISFLCQDASAQINGADLRVDGGYTVR